MANLNPTSSYSDPKYGILKRAYIPGEAGQQIDAAVPASSAKISFPTKIAIKGFGIMSAASDIVCSTSSEFRLENAAGTALASIVFDGTTTIASGAASVAAIETATNLAKNTGVYMWVGTNTGTTGSVYGVVDYVEEFQAGV